MAEFNLRKAVLQYRNPDISLDELSIVDTASQKGDIKANERASNNIQKKYTGMSEPLIKINNTVVSGLAFFKLDLSGFKPQIIFKFSTIDERFIFTSFPKDGDIVSVYIRARGEMFKPIRMDFIITEVITPFSYPSTTKEDASMNFNASQGSYQTYTIMGEIRIPKLYKHVSKSFKGNSSDALIKISEDLTLGYASNEARTKDDMVWISPNTDYETLIKNISNSSWLTEEDYFDCFIDQYYNINLINLKKQFDEQNKDLETMRMAYGTDYIPDMSAGTEANEVEFPILLTNATNYSKSPLYIKSFSIEHNAGQINNELGYFQRVQFYDSKLVSDKPKNKYVEYNIESITNKNLSSRDTLYKGRLGEKIYKEEIKKTYVGTMYFENVHENFHQAQIQNILNRSDSYKIILRIKTRAWNPWIYRGQSIPVNIIHESSTTVGSDSKYSTAANSNASSAPPAGKRAPNIFLSGDYVVLGISVEFNLTDKLHQVLILGKKQWTMNPGFASDPNTLNPFEDDANFNDLKENTSSTLQENAGILNNDIFK
jgi:hypothetical protein